MKNTENDDVDSLLRLLARDASFQVDQVRLAHAASAAETNSTRRTTPGRAVMTWGILGMATALGLGLAAPALADGIQQLAHTGRYGPVTTESDSTEWIASTGSDYSESIAALYPEWLPLPQSMPKTLFKSETIAQLSTLDGESQASSFVSTFEHDARCVWVDEWLLADSAGDQQRMAAAASVLTESVGWPATVAVAGGGFLEHLTDVANAASEGDRELLENQRDSDCASIPSGLKR